MIREMTNEETEELKKFAKRVVDLAYRSVPTTFVDYREIYREITGRVYLKDKPWENVKKKLKLIIRNPRILDEYVFIPYRSAPRNGFEYTVFFCKSQEDKSARRGKMSSGFRIRLRKIVEREKREAR